MHPLLDAVQTLSQLDAFDAARFFERVAAEVAPLAGETLEALGAELDALRGVLAELERFAQKSMTLRLDQALARDPLPRELRLLLTTTIANYAGDRPLLRGRIGIAFSRIDRARADELTARAFEAAERVLDDRAALRAGVSQLVQQIAAARLPSVKKAARDRKRPEAERHEWARARVDLEQLGARPELVESAPFAARLARLPPPPDEPEEPEEEGPSRFSLLEID
jgi:hypothetical protein